MAITLRAMRPDEVDVVCALVNRSAAHDGVSQVLSVEELRQDLFRDDIDLADDTRVAVTDDGDVVGWSYVMNPPAEVRLERAGLIGDVDPDHRGQGIGGELLAWSLARARQRLAQRTHGLPTLIWTAAYEWMAPNHRLYARFGFTPIRWFDEMIRPLTELPAVPAPDGVTLVPWSDDRDDELRSARNDAFADHWGSEPVDPTRWHQLVRGHGARADVSVFAVERTTGEVVGVCINHAYPEDDDVTGRREAWIHNVGTVRRWRRRGLASAMIAWSLAAFEAAGFSHAVLSVDADSPSGAGRLYSALGFQRLRRTVMHGIEAP